LVSVRTIPEVTSLITTMRTGMVFVTISASTTRTAAGMIQLRSAPSDVRARRSSARANRKKGIKASAPIACAMTITVPCAA
jgi:hypothetical protein